MNAPDAMFTRMLRDPQIADAGFSDAVMTELPRRRRLRPATARRLSLGGAAVAGGVATATLAPPVERLLDTWAPGGVAAMLGAALMLVIVILPALAVDHYQR